jgi:hypothetical protein
MKRIGKCWNVLGTAAVVFCLASASPASAGPNTGRLSLSGGFDFVTAYFFRGILQERTGLIWEPYLTLNANLYGVEDYDLHRDGPVSSVDLFAGTWNSLQSAQTGGTDENNPVFYETDWFGGANIGLFNKATAGFSYVAYTSPSDAFKTVQEFDLNLSLDDSDWLGKFALNPSAVFAYELEGSAFGPNNGAYLQLGIRPTWEAIKSETYPVTVAFPITTGLSLANYYETSSNSDNTWGYTSFGIQGSVPLAFMGEDWGSWSATMGATLYTFNHNLQEANKGNDPWVVGQAGISVSY